MYTVWLHLATGSHDVVSTVMHRLQRGAASVGFLQMLAMMKAEPAYGVLVLHAHERSHAPVPVSAAPPLLVRTAAPRWLQLLC